MPEPTTPPHPDEDIVDQLLRDWARERPELDTSAMAVVGRLLHLGALLQSRAGRHLQDHGLSYTELDVLATLRRSGAPYQLSPTALRKSVLLTSGAMTACLNRLERRGLIGREPDAADRRLLMARLTGEGLRLVEDAIVSHFTQADRAILGLEPGERAELARLLRKFRLQLRER
ncbi:MarR family transcriptional regulator [Sphingomonas cannabina]|uniref:MarR family winged helix-turn-helix transcriptional regulator n=1 Tax=Sphingomonas cannabina TaxID=2899123 RepID=UPI001F321A11|nr:MarR family transcriptional regulator [Sphingomonas cannabina]UIJ46158.1 MarR family transcriptional regulator [Sphingomonas cannabina]